MSFSDYMISKGIPVPARRVGAVRKYPFSDMVPGDSFVAGNSTKDVERVRAAASYWRIRHPEFKYRFSILKCEDGLYRCFCLVDPRKQS